MIRIVLADDHALFRAGLRRLLEAEPRIRPIILDSTEYLELQKKDKPLYERINTGIELHGG